MSELKLNFVPLQQKYLALMHLWLQEPMVKKWYSDDQEITYAEVLAKYQPRINGQGKVHGYIIHANDRAIGFIQYYALCDHLPDGIRSKGNALFKYANPKKIAGIDFFIANASYRLRGLGVKIMQQFIGTFTADHFQMAVLDPSSDNHIAIRCYTKCGFAITNYSEDKNTLIMVKKC